MKCGEFHWILFPKNFIVRSNLPCVFLIHPLKTPKIGLFLTPLKIPYFGLFWGNSQNSWNSQNSSFLGILGISPKLVIFGHFRKPLKNTPLIFLINCSFWNMYHFHKFPHFPKNGKILKIVKNSVFVVFRVVGKNGVFFKKWEFGEIYENWFMLNIHRFPHIWKWWKHSFLICICQMGYFGGGSCKVIGVSPCWDGSCMVLDRW